MNRRAAVAATVEVLVAAGMVVLAVRWWHRGMLPVEVAGAELFRVDGRWWAAAVLAVTVAGLLLIDAGRRAVLAARRPTAGRGAGPAGPDRTTGSRS